MDQKVLDELRQIRNDFMHNVGGVTIETFVKRLNELGFSLSSSDGQQLRKELFPDFGQYFVPKDLFYILDHILMGFTAEVITDPCAGLGILITKVKEITCAKKVIACTAKKDIAILGQAINKSIEWHISEPLGFLEAIEQSIDLVVSIPPFGYQNRESATIINGNEKFDIRRELNELIIISATKKLAENGIGLFVVPPNLFFRDNSIIHLLDNLGIGFEAIFALPPGTFAPYTNISSFLVITRNKVIPEMFVAQLSNDYNTNIRIINNYKENKREGNLDTGCYVNHQSFRSIEQLKWEEKIRKAKARYGTEAIRLGDIALSIKMGRYGDDFFFANQENQLFIPTIGNTEVVISQSEFKIKRQNYAQIIVDPTHSFSQFVSGFLNTEFGKEIRENGKHGTVIFKLNKKALADLIILIPKLETQKAIIEAETKIVAEQNSLKNLQNELQNYRLDLWSNPQLVNSVNNKINNFSTHFSSKLKEQSSENLEVWIETLPYPLASILRIWEATRRHDYKDKYEHLLHFFEASAEFISMIFLSAFSSSESFFEPHKQKLIETIRNQKLDFQRSTFGVWKIIIEYFSKQTRLMLNGKMEDNKLCGDIFANPSLKLPESISNKKLIEIISKTNSMRNDWPAHGGIVGQEESRLRNEKLVNELQELRGVIGNIWSEVQLVQCINCKPYRGVFENEIDVLMGSNNEFLKQNYSMSEYLDVDSLYLHTRDHGRALRLLPLVYFSSSPKSTKKACYFYNRLEKDGVRYISYHCIDQPETRKESENISDLIKLFTV